MGTLPTALLVDDEHSILEELSWHLQQRGWRVLTAPDGCKAEELCRKHFSELQLVVTDIRMPGHSGQTLVKKIAEERKSMRPAVFIMTAYDDVSREDAHVIGADAIFQKPFRVRELVAAAEHFVKIAEREKYSGDNMPLTPDKAKIQ
ncbi:MAG: hypothetical protein RLZZ488_682 [Pseudomonadota bacterium]|jgi:DNA-binding response OmpR family regulator